MGSTLSCTHERVLPGLEGCSCSFPTWCHCEGRGDCVTCLGRRRAGCPLRWALWPRHAVPLAPRTLESPGIATFVLRLSRTGSWLPNAAAGLWPQCLLAHAFQQRALWLQSARGDPSLCCGELEQAAHDGPEEHSRLEASSAPHTSRATSVFPRGAGLGEELRAVQPARAEPPACQRHQGGQAASGSLDRQTGLPGPRPGTVQRPCLCVSQGLCSPVTSGSTDALRWPLTEQRDSHRVAMYCCKDKLCRGHMKRCAGCLEPLRSRSQPSLADTEERKDMKKYKNIFQIKEMSKQESCVLWPQPQVPSPARSPRPALWCFES